MKIVDRRTRRGIGLSGSHSPAFKQTMGMPPHQWLMRRRVERTKELLLDSRFTLAEIALASVCRSKPSQPRLHQSEAATRTWRRRHHN